MKRLLPWLLCTLPLQAQDFIPHDEAPVAAGKAQDDKKPEKAEEDTAALESAARSADRKLERAKLKLEIAEMSVAMDLERAALSLEDKRAALAKAKIDLDIYKDFDGAASVASAQQSVARAKSRLVSQKQDLEGILRIYAEEEEATAKDEIIRRHVVSVEFAEKDVERTEKALQAATVKFEVETDAKEWAVDKAAKEAALAERGIEKAQLAAKLSIMEAKDAVASAEEALEAARRKLAKKESK